MRSGAAWIASEPPSVQNEFLDGLSEGSLMALPYLFEFWALPHQLPPEGEWFTWVIMGGRGAGKTRAGAEWVRAMVEGPKPMDLGSARRVALVGETIDQVREVMVFGESGILTRAVPEVGVVALGALAVVFVGAGTSVAPNRDAPTDPRTRTH